MAIIASSQFILWSFSAQLKMWYWTPWLGNRLQNISIDDASLIYHSTTWSVLWYHPFSVLPFDLHSFRPFWLSSLWIQQSGSYQPQRQPVETRFSRETQYQDRISKAVFIGFTERTSATKQLRFCASFEVVMTYHIFWLDAPLFPTCHAIFFCAYAVKTLQVA